jgi:methylated-DNA-[protein]-cysteine S-methyltransferase
MTYGDVACAAGSPGAARAVGSLMKTNRNPSVPCHRVVCADGFPGAYNRGADRKARLLREEGVVFIGGKIDMVRSRYAQV